MIEEKGTPRDYLQSYSISKFVTFLITLGYIVSYRVAFVLGQDESFAFS